MAHRKGPAREGLVAITECGRPIGVTGAGLLVLMCDGGCDSASGNVVIADYEQLCLWRGGRAPIDERGTRR
jgi:hypothetical protein